MKNKKLYIILIIVSLIILLYTGITYAYFSSIINGESNTHVVTSGTLKLIYTDELDVSLNNAFPGDYLEKEIFIENAGTFDTNYSLTWEKLNNGILLDELVIEATCTRYDNNGNVSGTCEDIVRTPVKGKTIKENILIEAGYKHKYNIKITFIDTGKVQDYNKNKTFTGRIGIVEYDIDDIYCTYTGTMIRGAEFVKGPYTYRYKQQGNFLLIGLLWDNIDDDGWGVQISTKLSTDPVTEAPCKYINNKPVVSYAYMFSVSKASSIDLSKFDSSLVTNMSHMFRQAATPSIDLTPLDTSNVTDMSFMFKDSDTTSITLGNIDTGKVTTLEGMFYKSKATKIDVSTINTSSVTTTNSMFELSEATSINLNNLDTSNVLDMTCMFKDTQATELDLRSFNTSKCTDMKNMFRNSQAKKIDMSSFDTSSVTSMLNMFQDSKAEILDLSSFDTTNVTTYTDMFKDAAATIGYAKNETELANFKDKKTKLPDTLIFTVK